MTVQILKYDYIIFQGQDLFPLLRITIKVNGIRFGFIFAFQTTFPRHLHCSAKRKAICSFIHRVKHLLIHSVSNSGLYSPYVPDPGLDTGQALVSKAGPALPSRTRSLVVKSCITPRLTTRTQDPKYTERPKGGPGTLATPSREIRPGAGAQGELPREVTIVPGGEK